MRTLLLAFCLIALVFGAELQQTCRSCTTNTCSAPWASLNGTCQNGEWVYSGPISLQGTVALSCAVRVNGVVNFGAGSTLSMTSCARLSAETINAPQGVGISLDLQGNPVVLGSKQTFATFRSVTGYVSSATVSNVGSGPDFAIFAELANNQGNVLFVAPGTPDPTQNGKNMGSTDPNFDANGDRVRMCSRYTCSNPSVCNDPTGGTGTCDTTSGEWVIPNDITVSTANLSCPLRIQGNFRASSALSIHACARISVTGVAIMAGQTDSDRVAVSFDLNEWGKPQSGDRINWLSATGGIIGGVRVTGFSNIWDTQNTVNLVNQRCGNGYNVIFYPINSVSPGETCPGTVAANAIGDDFAGDSFADGAFVDANAGDLAWGDVDAAFVDEGDMALHGFAVEVNAVDEALADVDAAFVDGGDAVETLQAASPGAWGDDAGFVDAGDMAVDADAPINDGDWLVMDAAVGDSSSNTASSSSSDAMPAYAVALVVLGVLLVVGLIFVQVQLVLLYRSHSLARE